MVSSYRSLIIVAEGLDVNFYLSAESVERSVEAIDVEDNIYKAYDALGDKVHLVSQNNKISIVVDHQENLEAELEELLADFLEATGTELDKSNESLSSLLKRCEKFYQ